jgi:hypothetical protein
MFEWHDQKLVVFAFLGCFHELLPIVLDFWGDLRGPWHLVHVWVTWPKTRRFRVLGAFSWAIAHSFGVSRWFTRTMTLSTFFRGMTKTSLFVCFRDIFVSYCTLFWGSGDSYKEYDSLYILERNDKNKSLFFAFMAVFVNYCPQFWGDLQGPWHLVHVWVAWLKTRCFLHFRAVFTSYCQQFWGFGAIYKAHKS